MNPARKRYFILAGICFAIVLFPLLSRFRFTMCEGMGALVCGAYYTVAAVISLLLGGFFLARAFSTRAAPGGSVDTTSAEGRRTTRALHPGMPLLIGGALIAISILLPLPADMAMLRFLGSIAGSLIVLIGLFELRRAPLVQLLVGAALVALPFALSLFSVQTEVFSSGSILLGFCLLGGGLLFVVGLVGVVRSFSRGSSVRP